MLNEAWNHFYLVLFLFAGWTVAVAVMGAKHIFMDYDAFPDETK